MAHVDTRLDEFSKEIFKVINQGIVDLGKTLKNEIAEMAAAKDSEINSSDEVELLAVQAKGKGREEEGQRTREWVERSSDNMVRTPARSNPVAQPTTTMATPVTMDRNIEAALDNIMSPQQPGESTAVYNQRKLAAMQLRQQLPELGLTTSTRIVRSPPRTTGPGYERVTLHYDVGGGYRPGHQANPPDDFDIRSIPEESIRPMSTQGRGTPQRSTTSNHQTVWPSKPHYQAGSERDEGPVIVQEPPI